VSYYQAAKTTNFDKRNAEILHAIRRARERYGLELSVADIEGLARMIQKQATRRVRAVSNSRVIHELECRDRTVWVVYDKKRHTLVTFLPRGEQ
jgi:hypothetical protein